MNNPWELRKAKVLLWFWLNFHPAEAQRGAEYGLIWSDGDHFDPDMSIVNDREYVIGACSHHEAYVDADPTKWHDVNIAVKLWLKGMSDKNCHLTISWLKNVKGKPIERWHSMYTLSESPQFEGLVEILKLRKILNGDTD